MSAQDDFNDKVLALLEELVAKVDPHGFRSERKHDIVGDPLHDKLWAAAMAKPEGTA